MAEIGDQPVQTTVIRGSRAKTALFLLGSLAFVAVGTLLPEKDHAQRLKLWLAAAFFGLCALVFIWQLIRPQTLTLDETGFTLSGRLRGPPCKVAWRDVEGFFVLHLPRGGKMIAYNYQPSARPTSIIAKVSRKLGADGGLSGMWSKSPQQMVEELNAYRERALAARPRG